MSIAVNRIAGARGALVHSTETAMLARQHNDANVLCLGSRLHDQDLEVIRECLFGDGV